MTQNSKLKDSPIEHSEQSLKAWLAVRVATYVRLPPEQIKPNVSLAEYGLDSVYAFSLVGDIEDYLDLSIEPTLMWDHPTIEALAKALLNHALKVS